jgi:hypothetical protein
MSQNDSKIFKRLREAVLSPFQFKATDTLKSKTNPEASQERRQQVLNKLQTLFKVGFSGKGNRPVDKFISFKNKGTDSKGTTHLDRENFPADVAKLFDYWTNDCHDSAASWEQRDQLYKDMEMIYYNSPLISRAIELIADEVIQADSNQQPIFIEASPKVKKFILDFFDKVGIYELIRPTIVDIIQFGNAGWLLALEDSGVNEIIPINVFDLKDRFQFTPFEVQQKLNKSDSFFKKLQGMDRMNQLIKSITSKEDDITRFKSYLLGYQIGDYAIPPWRFIHFRNTTNKSPFKPFGVPVFIHSIAPYRQYDAAMTLQVLARGAKFPRDVYELNLPNVIDPAEKIAFATDFITEYQNSGLGVTKKEYMGVGEKIVTIKDLYEYKQETPAIDLDKLDDINLLRDDLIISTQLPRSLLDSNDAGFGTQGYALIQQSKPLSRLIYRIQNIFLQNLSQLIKIHMIHSNGFALDEIDFVLSMPYPEAQTNTEIINSQSSLLTLANDIIAAIEDKILGGEKVPPEIIKKVYQKILPYDDSTINSWFHNEPEPEKQETNKQLLKNNIKLHEKFNNLEASLGKQKLSEHIDTTIFNYKQKHLKEGVLQNRHYFSSKNIYVDFPAEKLREFDVNRIEKIKNKGSIKEYLKEEICLQEISEEEDILEEEVKELEEEIQTIVNENIKEEDTKENSNE